MTLTDQNNECLAGGLAHVGWLTRTRPPRLPEEEREGHPLTAAVRGGLLHPHELPQCRRRPGRDRLRGMLEPRVIAPAVAGEPESTGYGLMRHTFYGVITTSSVTAVGVVAHSPSQEIGQEGDSLWMVVDQTEPRLLLLEGAWSGCVCARRVRRLRWSARRANPDHRSGQPRGQGHEDHELEPDDRSRRHHRQRRRGPRGRGQGLRARQGDMGAERDGDLAVPLLDRRRSAGVSHRGDVKVAWERSQ